MSWNCIIIADKDLQDPGAVLLSDPNNFDSLSIARIFLGRFDDFSRPHPHPLDSLCFPFAGHIDVYREEGSGKEFSIRIGESRVRDVSAGVKSIPVWPLSRVEDCVDDNVCRSADTADCSNSEGSEGFGLVSPARRGKRQKNGCSGIEIGCIFENQLGHVGHVGDLVGCEFTRKATIEEHLNVVRIELTRGKSSIGSDGYGCRSKIILRVLTQCQI